VGGEELEEEGEGEEWGHRLSALGGEGREFAVGRSYLAGEGTL
jgi:hypothetical protein